MHKFQAFVFCVFLFSATAAFGQPVAGWTEASTNTTTSNNVGIGVTPPLSILHVAKNIAFNGGADAQGIFSGTGSTPLTTLIGYDTTSDYGFIQAAQYGASWNKNLALQAKGGNVGVGTTAPLNILHVAKNLSFVNGSDAQGIFSGTGSSPLTTLIGYDTVNDYGFIQAAQYGSTWNKNLVFQTKGGNVGIGLSAPLFKLDVAGDAHVSGTLSGGNIQAKYQDFAEWVPASEIMTAGTVVVIDRSRPSGVTPSKEEYDSSVAGVVSAQPGIILGEGSSDKAQIASVGRVKVKVDARRYPIGIGDLLVTSEVRGMAMASQPIDIGGVKVHRPGTLIGKALEPLRDGTGEIMVLLSLQ
jgi:hypothetical protein